MYQCRFIALLRVPHKKATKFVKSLLDMKLDDGVGGQCATDSINGTVVSVIWVPEFAITPFQLGILTHECLHACLLTLRERGQGVHTDDHEHLTYFHQFVFERILAAWIKKK